ncbi:MAG: hypothetical protein LC124_09770 [Ignavibacteriales bacterium]|nr:hypothetical protein [Ignavibacterium sp.]MCZ2269128.1 hypothetical protein [Ignavibacteriales bacterium]HMN17659.1 hypothetical protein [Ignavibacteriaceae bacterium]
MNWNGIISLLLACIEFLLLFNLLVFVKKDKLNIIALVMIALLAGYQTMEFLMCQIELQSSFYPYFAFVIISFLPPLNLILALSLTHNFNLNPKSWLIFLPAVLFSIYYTFVIQEFVVTSCTVLYATYHYPLGDLYGFFYYLPILISIILLALFVRKDSEKEKRLIGKVLLFGGIFISIPPVLGFTLMFTGSYSLMSAMESIMCKFAFVYALCLTIICLLNSPFNEERNYLKLFSGFK